ncbi:MAG: GSCFA domain-containing protein [Bacteroidales bacterium]|nr:GSCFA domain-containing protein [Bacteroidales bacterium]
MSNFRTIISAKLSENKINYHTPVLFMGSCFTENIGRKLYELKFPTLINPFGVLYNPSSVKQSIELLLDKKQLSQSDLGYYNEMYYSFFHDTEFSDMDKESCLHNINNTLSNASEFFQKTKYIIITFGTAWVYKYIKTGKIVSNCHKIPSKEFKREKLSVDEIYSAWKSLVEKINKFNPQVKIIFTVSPVRHWKDGAVENQLSKSTLILAVHRLKDAFENIEYFNSYEIMMDDLRDYRFYDSDMLHPSKDAIEYIWANFLNTYFELETIQILKEVEKIVRAEKHRPFNTETKAHAKFIQKLAEKKQILRKKYPFILFENNSEQ